MATIEEVQINSKSPEKWESYIETLFRQTKNKQDIIENIDVEEIPTEENITQQEVHTAIKELKNIKASGLDGIPNEMIKFGEWELGKALSFRKMENKHQSSQCITKETK